MSEENENLSTAEVKLLLRVRLNMEDEFASGRRKKSVLWNKVVEEVKKINRDINIDRHIAQRKFLNMLVSYKRIKSAIIPPVGKQHLGYILKILTSCMVPGTPSILRHKICKRRWSYHRRRH
ncbi:uncharacterized protein LOC118732309 [Rhagoletis pomonella]|uniref:uncharacterized protein LOC118732309 n=1 Tax=Rhagoletis pomonella TaxID=28610 RepID=UPI00177F7172|nr:uncharacterized protein LOC118732309 [Rhagoletis pomonella]